MFDSKVRSCRQRISKSIYNHIFYLSEEDEQGTEHELAIPENSPTMLRRYSTASTHASTTPNREIEKEDFGSPLDQLAERFGGKKIKKGTIDVWWLFDDGGKKLKNVFVVS